LANYATIYNGILAAPPAVTFIEFSQYGDEIAQLECFVSDTNSGGPSAVLAISISAQLLSLIDDFPSNGYLTGLCLRGKKKRRSSQRHNPSTVNLFKIFLNQGPALGWIKDDRGRYIFLNCHFAAHIKTGDLQLEGHCDSEWLPKTLSIRTKEQGTFQLVFSVCPCFLVIDW